LVTFSFICQVTLAVWPGHESDRTVKLSSDAYNTISFNADKKVKQGNSEYQKGQKPVLNWTVQNPALTILVNTL